MRIKNAARVAAVVTGALVAVACATPDVGAGTVVDPAPVAPGDTAPAAPGAVEQTVTVASTAGLITTNTIHRIGNETNNMNIALIANGPGFAFFDNNLNYVRNTDFGTFSPADTAFNEDGSLTVFYTLNDGIYWSDGVPVDAADMFLLWAAMNNRFDTITEEAYEDQTEGDENYVPLPEHQVFFDAGSPGITGIPVAPSISDNGRTLTFTFEEPRADWEFQFGGVSPVPAHVLGRLALGIEDPMEAKQAIVSAFGGPENYLTQDGTEEATVTNTFGPAGPVTTFTEPNLEELHDIADIFNDSFNFSELPDDPSLFLSYGPYVMAEILDGQFIRFERNPHFNWAGSVFGRPVMDEITLRIVQGDLAQALALQNHEVDVIQPGNNVTADLLPTLSGIEGINYQGIPMGVYEHITLQFTNGGPFDPAYWAAEGVANPEAAARAVRRAFLQTVPRDQIINQIIRQIDPEATTRDSWLVLPGSPGYDNTTANNNIGDLTGGPAAARETLEAAGLEDFLPIDVRLLYGLGNPRREQQFVLIQAAAPDLFNVIDEGDTDWSARVFTNPGSYDAALFAWASTSTAFLNAEANTFTNGNNNLGGFSNERVDELWLEARQETNPTRVNQIATEIEQILMEEGFGLPIFQFPGVLAYRDDIQNVSAIMISPQHLWNFQDWTRTAAN